MPPLTSLEPGPVEAPACATCGSRDVRASRRTYPHDKVRLAGRMTSFWRCGHCGERFMGPPARPGPRKRRQGSSRSHRDSLAHTIEAARRAKRWFFPLIAILATIVAVILILDWQAAPLEHVTPPRR